MDDVTQINLFRDAVDCIGGQAAAAGALAMSERSVRFLLAGERRLHAGILEAMSRALIDHANVCRALERQLSPAFIENRTAAQAVPPKHDGNRSAKPD
jgi:DNA-binding transcriptional regulator YdaS (Cro superfamily)